MYYYACENTTGGRALTASKIRSPDAGIRFCLSYLKTDCCLCPGGVIGSRIALKKRWSIDRMGSSPIPDTKLADLKEGIAK